MSQKRYKVGQVVYVIMSEQNKVLPFQIVEEVTKRTLQGEATLYKVMFGGDANKKHLVLSELKGEVFETLPEVKRFLMDNVTNFVNEQLAAAQKRASVWYKVAENDGFEDAERLLVQEPQDVPEEPIGTISEEDTNLIELPDGRVVKAKVTRAHQA
jgi:hypothetical protein